MTSKVGINPTNPAYRKRAPDPSFDFEMSRSTYVSRPTTTSTTTKNIDKDKDKDKDKVDLSLPWIKSGSTRSIVHSFKVHPETKKLLIDVTPTQLQALNEVLEQTLWGLVPKIQQQQIAVNVNYQTIQQQAVAADRTKDLILAIRQALNTLPAFEVYGAVRTKLEKVLAKYEAL